jgi:3-dehydroquinate dehydratase-2
MKLLVLNGPNLNLLGTREPAVYGYTTLNDLEREWQTIGSSLTVKVTSFQSNHEGVLIDAIQDARDDIDAIVINAGALSHYSRSLADALAAVAIPYVEVHISNIDEREEWRQHSVLAAGADAVIMGRGTRGYLDAIRHLHTLLTSPPATRNYGTEPWQVLDVRIPAGTGPHPAVVVIHGGYWRSVWKRDLMDRVAVDLVGRGFATVNIEYATGHESFAAAEPDVDAAIDWVREHATEFDIDQDKLILVGHSAGGYLALRRVHSRTDIAGVVALGAVADLASVARDFPTDNPVDLFLGGSMAEIPHRWDAASITGQPSAIVHLIHGSDDAEVDPVHSEVYTQENEGASALTMLDGVGHMELIDPEDPSWDTVVAAILDIVS